MLWKIAATRLRRSQYWTGQELDQNAGFRVSQHLSLQDVVLLNMTILARLSLFAEMVVRRVDDARARGSVSGRAGHRLYTTANSGSASTGNSSECSGRKLFLAMLMFCCDEGAGTAVWNL